MQKQAYEVTGTCDWVAGKRVAVGNVVTLTKAQAEYELARGVIRPIAIVKAAEAAPQRRTRKR